MSVVPEKPTKESSTEDETAVSHPEPLGEETSFYEGRCILSSFLR